MKHQHRYSQDVRQGFYSDQMMKLREENFRLRREIQLLTGKNHDHDDIEEKFKLKLKKIRSLSSFNKKNRLFKESSRKNTKKSMGLPLYPTPIEKISPAERNPKKYTSPKIKTQKIKMNLPGQNIQSLFVYEHNSCGFKTPATSSPPPKYIVEPFYAHTMDNSPVSIQLMENSSKTISNKENTQTFIQNIKQKKDLSKQRFVYEKQQKSKISQKKIIFKQEQFYSKKERLLMNNVYLAE